MHLTRTPDVTQYPHAYRHITRKCYTSVLCTWKKRLLKYSLTKYRYFGDLSLFGPFLHNTVSFFPTFGKRLASYTTTVYPEPSVCVGYSQFMLELTLLSQFLNSTPSHLYKSSLGNTMHSVHLGGPFCVRSPVLWTIVIFRLPSSLLPFSPSPHLKHRATAFLPLGLDSTSGRIRRESPAG